jgi:hypothetical protein
MRPSISEFHSKASRAFLRKGLSMPKTQVRIFSWRKSLLAGLVVAVTTAAGVWYALDGGGVAAKPETRPQAPPVPVTVAAVTRQDVPLLLEGIGTVQPVNIVTIRSRVDGELQKVFFTGPSTGRKTPRPPRGRMAGGASCSRPSNSPAPTSSTRWTGSRRNCPGLPRRSLRPCMSTSCRTGRRRSGRPSTMCSSPWP